MKNEEASMAATVTKTHVLNLLEMRFDYQSARNVVTNWRKGAGLKGDPADYGMGELSALADYIEANNEGASSVATAVRKAVSAEAPEPVKAVAKPAPVPEKKGDRKAEDKDRKKKKK